ncbi:hypothetical protein VSX64_23010, partial [Aurantimonas sp. C2-6-R+9]|nr:hypothetical protein [Aurantimonas sp. C2-6-R+9]
MAVFHSAYSKGAAGSGDKASGAHPVLTGQLAGERAFADTERGKTGRGLVISPAPFRQLDERRSFICR